MSYLIKLILFLLVCFNTNADENKISKILFKINNKVFTNVDLEKRTEYVELTNNFNSSELNDIEKKEILDDYISSLIFNEYYLEKKIIFENLNDEINSIYKISVTNYDQSNTESIKNFKKNIKIDLIRKKIIEKQLNLNKNILLKDPDTLDLLYNYNLKYIIINEKFIDKELLKNIKDRNKFNDLNKYLIKNEIDFFYKEEDINNKTIISTKIKKIIDLNLPIYSYSNNGYITIISINKNLESYDGIYVKLINFKSNTILKVEELQCDNLNETIDINKTIFKEYEYSKLNDKIKNNLKSINDYILFNNSDVYNYIILCDLRYDEQVLKNINFNKNVNSLVDKIQKNFIKKYKNEYKFYKNK